MTRSPSADMTGGMFYELHVRVVREEGDHAPPISIPRGESTLLYLAVPGTYHVYLTSTTCHQILLRIAPLLKQCLQHYTHLKAHSRRARVPADSAVLRRTKLVHDRTKLVRLTTLMSTIQPADEHWRWVMKRDRPTKERVHLLLND